MAVHPAEPLAPRRSYRVEATLRSDATPVRLAGGDPNDAEPHNTQLTRPLYIEAGEARGQGRG